MGKPLDFNGTVFHRYRGRGPAPYIPSKITINRGVQARRQKRLKVSLATVRLPEEQK